MFTGLIALLLSPSSPSVLVVVVKVPHNFRLSWNLEITVLTLNAKRRPRGLARYPNADVVSLSEGMYQTKVDQRVSMQRLGRREDVSIDVGQVRTTRR